jgi:hypothetical protein
MLKHHRLTALVKRDFDYRDDGRRICKQRAQLA